MPETNKTGFRPATSDQIICEGARAFIYKGVFFYSLKEVIQPHVPVRLPCYDFTPVISHTVVSALPEGLSYLLLVQPTSMV